MEHMPNNEYARGFTDALEYVLGIYNQLMSKAKVPGSCKDCRFVEEIGQLMLLAKDKQFEQIRNELGHFLR
jgi:hypothetical protein